MPFVYITRRLGELIIPSIVTVTKSVNKKRGVEFRGKSSPLNYYMAQSIDVVIRSTRGKAGEIAHTCRLYPLTIVVVSQKLIAGRSGTTRVGASAPDGCASQRRNYTRRELSGYSSARVALREVVPLVVGVQEHRLYRHSLLGGLRLARHCHLRHDKYRNEAQ